MMSTQRSKIGKLGERIAAKFLQNKGFKIIDSNYWRPFGEIDLIAKKAGIVHFVEVKTVIRETNTSVSRITTKDAYRAEDNLHPYKLKRVERASVDYLDKHNLSEEVWQIDAVAVYLSLKNMKASCIYIPNVC